MAIAGELVEAAEVAGAHGAVGAVLAAELGSGERTYLVALEDDSGRRWLVLDGGFATVVEREVVREVAGIVALCELAVELAASDGAAVDAPPAAAAAAAELVRVVGSPPWLASPDFLDRVGAAVRRVEHARADFSSPFASALAAHTATVDAFIRDVELHHRLPLR